MGIENIVEVKLEPLNQEEYTTKYNLILLENSKITPNSLMELLVSFYKQCPESFTFIFDFSGDIINVINFTPIISCIEKQEYPDWSYRVCNPVYLGNADTPTCTTQRLNICSDAVYILLGNYGVCKIENVYCDM